MYNKIVKPWDVGRSIQDVTTTLFSDKNGDGDSWKFVVMLICDKDSDVDFYLRNKTSVPVFYRRIKYRYEFGCVWIRLHEPERVRIFYYVVWLHGLYK